MKLRYVKHFSDKKSWQRLTNVEIVELKEHVSKLILPEEGDHELARRFDIIMLNLTLAMLVSRDPGRFISRVASIAKQLSVVNVPEVKNNIVLLKELQTEHFWKMAYVKRLEEVRVAIRELMKYLESNRKETVYTSMEDDIDLDNITEEPLIEWSTKLQSYKDRVETYIRKNKNHITIQKLRTNIPITQSELVSLEDMLFDGNERGTKEEFVKEYGDQPLGKFIRSIVGLDIQAANEAFSEFLQRGNLRADQMTFMKNIISFLEINGTIDKSMLFEPPFTDINDQGLLGVFDDAEAVKVIRIIETINKNAEAA
jgi:type I restriction enzyme R subunit